MEWKPDGGDANTPDRELARLFTIATSPALVRAQLSKEQAFCISAAQKFTPQSVVQFNKKIFESPKKIM